MDTQKEDFTLIPDQIEILKQRGLKIVSSEETNHYFNHVGYFRLAGYWQFLQNNLISQTFYPGTTFKQVTDLYNFDRELKLLILDAIERIEVSFRAIMINHMCSAFGPDWISDTSLFFNYEKARDIIDTINIELDRSEEDFIKQHIRRYGRIEQPPAWKTLQILSCGTLSKIYGNISSDIKEKRIIANVYGLPKEEGLRSWMQVITVLRNCCAHHSRVCYRLFPIRPRQIRNVKLPWIKNCPVDDSIESRHLYYQLCVVRYFLHTACPGSNFSYRLMELLVKYPEIELDRMGFPENWEEEDLWQ